MELEDATHSAERAQLRIRLRFLESSSFSTYKEIFMAMPKVVPCLAIGFEQEETRCPSLNPIYKVKPKQYKLEGKIPRYDSQVHVAKQVFCSLILCQLL